MLRSCDAVGIGRIHAIHPTGGIPTFNETSGSAEKWVELVVHKSLEAAFHQLQSQEMQIYAAHLSKEAVDYRDVDYTKPTCILLGNEKAGVSEQAAAMADQHIIIPMLGMVESLNVSVATAVILFEAQRQRRAAGLYEHPQFSKAELNEQAYRLLYPKEAEKLKKLGLPYPQLSEEALVKKR
jgi:tRNA (guanosine-2'-O-)-methyltransferase